MDSIKYKYLYFLPIYLSLGSLLKNIWPIAIITAIALIGMCIYSDIYKQFRLKINNFLFYLWGTWCVVLFISLAKYYDHFDNPLVYTALFIVIIFLIYFLNKMGKIIKEN